MIIGRVTGEIHSTINHPFYDSKKLLVVEKTDPAGRPTGDYLIAVDVVDAGVGEPVLVLDEGNGARQVFASADAPVRSVVVGIIDEIRLASR
jgi:ethanolamine utilization protein EutN